MKTNVLLILMALVIHSCAIVNGGADKKVVQIKTSSQCGDCKERIESKLNYTKGIQYAELNVDTQILEVKYNEGKITLQEIRDLINDIGYDADDQKAPKENVEKLPLCCQPGGHK